MVTEGRRGGHGGHDEDDRHVKDDGLVETAVGGTTNAGGNGTDSLSTSSAGGCCSG